MILSIAVTWNNGDEVAVIGHCYRIDFPRFESEISYFTALTYTHLFYLYSNRKLLCQESELFVDIIFWHPSPASSCVATGQDPHLSHPILGVAQGSLFVTAFKA